MLRHTFWMCDVRRIPMLLWSASLAFLKYVKSTIRSRLTSDVLNTLMRVKISGPSLEEFHETFGKKCVDHWFSSKNRRPNEKKRKTKKSQAVSQLASSEGSGESDTEDDNMED